MNAYQKGIFLLLMRIYVLHVYLAILREMSFLYCQGHPPTVYGKDDIMGLHCRVCGAPVLDQQTACPQCGSRIERSTSDLPSPAGGTTIATEPPPKKRLLSPGAKAVAIGAIVSVFLLIVVIVGFVMASIEIDKTVQRIENEVTVSIFLNDAADENDVTALIGYINALPDVSFATYVSKEEALERFKEMSGEEVVDQLVGNPLPASIEFGLGNPNNVQPTVNGILEQDTLLRVVENPDNLQDSIRYGQQVVPGLFPFVGQIRQVCLLLIWVLGTVALTCTILAIVLGILGRKKTQKAPQSPNNDWTIS
jgi:hypothetical protein